MVTEPGLLTRANLIRHTYADGRDLDSRRSLYAYREPALDLVAEVVARVRDASGPVLDVGAGTGAYSRALRADRPDRSVVALDLSEGMVHEAGAPGVVADASALPVRSGSTGTVLALHMLYHVPAPEAAVSELARVLRPGGTVLLSSNAPGDKRELYALRDAAETDVTGLPPIWRSDSVGGRCTLDRAEELARRHFGRVRRVDFTGEVAVPEPEPVVEFCRSLRAWYAGEGFDDVLAAVRRRVRSEIARTGAFRFHVHTGLIACG